MPFFVPRKRKPSVKSTWTRIDKWLSKHLPDVQKSLNRGATKRQLKDFETLTRRVLPDDVKESLLIHNGQADVTTGVIFGLQLMPLDQMACSWEGVRPFEEDGSESRRAALLVWASELKAVCLVERRAFFKGDFQNLRKTFLHIRALRHIWQQKPRNL